MLKSIWKRIRSFRCISVPLFLMRSTTENHEIAQEGKFWTREKKFRAQEIPTRKIFGLTKYLQGNILDPRNTHEKIIWTHEIATKTRWHVATRPAKFSALHRKQLWKSLHFSRTFNTLSLQALSLQKILF